MATIQLGRTRSANKLISYAEKRAEVREGVNCPADFAKAQMKATRELWGKNEGIQAHHVIQSFKPGEVTPGVANEIGQELAQSIARGHECVVYTHADKDHIHNHIVINSVNYENGKKYHAHGKDAIEKFREMNDQLCKDRGLSVVKEPTAQQRYARAEYGLAKRGVMSWKDEIREVIDYERQHSTNYGEFKKNLTEKYNIEVKERGKNISFKHPDSQKFVRGKTLGLAYERGTLENDFTRERTKENASNQERGNTAVPNEQERTDRTSSSTERNAGAERSHEKLHQSNDGQIISRENDVGQRDREHQNDKQADSNGYALNLDEARENLKQQRRSVNKGFEKWAERDDDEQQPNTQENAGNSRSTGQQNERNQEPNGERNQQHEPTRTRELEPTRIKQQEIYLER